MRSALRTWIDLARRADNRVIGSDNLDGMRKYLKRDPKEASFRQVMAHYVHNAKKRAIPFELSYEELLDLITQRCHYCGSDPQPYNKNVSRKGKVWDNASPDAIALQTVLINGIDRMQPELGYALDNCVPCCKSCNYAKSDMSYMTFIAWLSRLVEYRDPRCAESGQMG